MIAAPYMPQYPGQDTSWHIVWDDDGPWVGNNKWWPEVVAQQYLEEYTRGEQMPLLTYMCGHFRPEPCPYVDVDRYEP